MVLSFFNKVAWFVLAAMLEGILLPSNMAGKVIFCLYRVKCLIVTFRCAINVTTSSFQHFPWSLSAKLCQKAVIHNFKNQGLVTWPGTDFLILSEWCGFEKPNHYYFEMTHDVTWPLSASGLSYLSWGFKLKSSSGHFGSEETPQPLYRVFQRRGF